MAPIDKDIENLKLDEYPASDSGYVSGAPTAANSPSPNLPDPFAPVRVSGGPPQFNFQVSGGLKSFDHSVDGKTQSRFHDVRGRIGAPLVAYVYKNKRIHSPTLIRLAVLGKSEEDARAWIIVFCDEKKSKRMRRFFKQDYVQQLCRPEDRNLPQFDVHVEPLAPIARGLSAWRDVQSSTSETLCGTMITFGDEEDTDTWEITGGGWSRSSRLGPLRLATLGGIVKVIRFDGSYALYGMTADHAATDTGEHNESDEDDSEASSEDEAEDGEDAETSLLQAKLDDYLKKRLDNGTPESRGYAGDVNMFDTPSKKGTLTKSPAISNQSE